MKLADWARQEGVTYHTAYRWFRLGQMPVPAEQLPSGTILVRTPLRQQKQVALYARVSSHDQKGDLERQVARLASYAASEGLLVKKVIQETASGLNGGRKQLLRLLADNEIDVIVVEHRDRLARFGVEMVEACLAASGRSVTIVEEGEIEDDLVRDMTDVLTSFCARLYGRRSARLRAQRALKCAEEAGLNND
jgi:predicted site-specific integrase-resolvase